MYDPTTPDQLVLRFRVEPECAGWRLDRYLGKRIPRLSRTRIQRILRGQATLDARGGLRPAKRVRPGQVLELRRPIPPEPDAPRAFGVVLEDDDVLVIDKPALLAMHATARYHRGTLTWLLRQQRPGAYVAFAHRLDRETSGVVACGKTPAAATFLKEEFAHRRVDKRYLAVTHGAPEADQGLVDLPLRLSPTAQVKVAMEVHPAGLPARTRWRVLRRAGRFALIECRPETGRQHQIRAHLAALGHPIVGDKLYPDERLFLEYAGAGWTDALRARLVLARQALHAAALTFRHPRTGAEVTAEAPLPGDLAALVGGA